MNKELSSQYDSKQIEDNVYKLWEESGYFNPDNLPARHKKPFTIIMPPPNANGSLHIGHALFVTLEDIMIRYQRMQGRKALWLPGADHAGFETQVVYNKKLEKEGRSFWEIPREQLYNEIKDFTLANKKYMEGQLKKLGASCDWSREKFTLDENIKQVVNETFKKLYNDGLVYRAEKPVNWCTKHQTTLSDLEIKYEERADKLYYIKYKLAGTDEYIEVATTRPETIPADIAIAVHPKSKWAKFIGKKVINPLTKTEIPVLSDMAVDLTFGTGALKITPFHDAVDFAVWQNHKEEINPVRNSPPISPLGAFTPLEKNSLTGQGAGVISNGVNQPFSVINQYGKMTQEAGPEMAGLKVKDAREKSVELLRPNFVKEPEDYKHQVSVCYKCGTVIEPRVMMQWFVKMTEKTNKNKKSLRDLAIDAVKSKKIKFIPARFEKIYMHWMKNLHDWNISRQIVWGIQIPVWYCQDMASEVCKKNNGVIVNAKNPEKCPHCGSANLKQETDVFDTWFSSGQWPYATLMTTKPGDFEKYYPTDVMETGWDILFFWVARMIMFGLYRTGKIPFKDVYLHGLVRDKERQKMSKSKNNVINPLEVAEVYGTDAVRMALVVGFTAGNDPIISEDKIRGYRNFATKIWNASRFVLMNYKKIDAKPKLTTKDKKNLKDLETAKKKITKYLDKYDFNHAAETAYHYFWHTFADKVIEESKPRINPVRNSPPIGPLGAFTPLEKNSLTGQGAGVISNGVKPENTNLADAAAAQETLIKILAESMKFLHPFMPFITEQIYQMLPSTKEKSLLMVEKW